MRITQTLHELLTFLIVWAYEDYSFTITWDEDLDKLMIIADWENESDSDFQFIYPKPEEVRRLKKKGIIDYDDDFRITALHYEGCNFRWLTQE